MRDLASRKVWRERRSSRTFVSAAAPRPKWLRAASRLASSASTVGVMWSPAGKCNALGQSRCRASLRAFFHSAAGDQKVSPGLVVDAADLDDRMSVGAVVNELAIADEHSGVSDVARRGTEKKQVARLKILTVDWDHTFPRGLLVGIARHVEPAGAHQHLREARTVEAKTRTASPQIGKPEKTLGEFNGFWNRQRLRVR